jgi:predicted house-cleaning noncanonical NTP pyrophosphatase (MazG superfamily)
MSRNYGKLVRDKIPTIINERGEEAVVRTVTGDELEFRMRLKIKEEMEELAIADGLVDELKEFADLYEILDAYRKQRGFTQADIKAARKEKNDSRGKFKDGVFLVSVRDKRTEEELEKEAEAEYLMRQLQNPQYTGSVITIKKA